MQRNKKWKCGQKLDYRHDCGKWLQATVLSSDSDAQFLLSFDLYSSAHAVSVEAIPTRIAPFKSKSRCSSSSSDHRKVSIGQKVLIRPPPSVITVCGGDANQWRRGKIIKVCGSQIQVHFKGEDDENGDDFRCWVSYDDDHEFSTNLKLLEKESLTQNENQNHCSNSNLLRMGQHSVEEEPKDVDAMNQPTDSNVNGTNCGGESSNTNDSNDSMDIDPLPLPLIPEDPEPDRNSNNPNHTMPPLEVENESENGNDNTSHCQRDQQHHQHEERHRNDRMKDNVYVPHSSATSEVEEHGPIPLFGAIDENELNDVDDDNHDMITSSDFQLNTAHFLDPNMVSNRINDDENDSTRALPPTPQQTRNWVQSEQSSITNFKVNNHRNQIHTEIEIVDLCSEDSSCNEQEHPDTPSIPSLRGSAGSPVQSTVSKEDDPETDSKPVALSKPQKSRSKKRRKKRKEKRLKAVKPRNLPPPKLSAYNGYGDELTPSSERDSDASSGSDYHPMIHEKTTRKIKRKSDNSKGSGGDGFECNECHKQFASKYRLKAHLMVHRERLFECKETGCSYRSKTKQGLKEHSVRHSKERPFECDLCGEKFKKKSYLKRHMTIHSGEKAYECKWCGSKFRTWGLCNSHTATVHGYDRKDKNAKPLGKRKV